MSKRKTADWLEDKSWHRIRNEMLLSPAFKAASPKATKLIFRLVAELGRHSGKENGNLICTRRDLNDCGLHPRDVAPAIREARVLGFIAYKKGRAGGKDYGKSHRFRLTFLPILDADGKEIEQPTDEWTQFDTTEEAKMAIQRAENRQKSRSLVPTVEPLSRGTNGGTTYSGNALDSCVKKPNDFKKSPVPTVEPLSTSVLTTSPLAEPRTGCEASPPAQSRLTWTTPTLTEVTDPDEIARLWKRLDPDSRLTADWLKRVSVSGNA